METTKPKLTLNRLLDMIEELPDERRKLEKIQKLKQNLLEIKFDEKNLGFGGNILMNNSEELINMLFED